MRSSQLQAIFFRRWVKMKRSKATMIISFLMTLIFSIVAIVAEALMKSLMGSSDEPLTFKSFANHPTALMFVTGGTTSIEFRLRELLIKMFRDDTGIEPEIFDFNSREELNDFLYEHQKSQKEPHYIAMGFGFNTSSSGAYLIDVYYNSTSYSTDRDVADVQVIRALWKDTFNYNTEFRYSSISVVSKMMDIIFSQVGPMLLTCGLISFVPMIITQPIIDIRGEIREFMMSCTLSLFAYWFGTFLIDWLLWTTIVTIVWLIFVASQVKTFFDNILNTWYCLLLMGPSFILFTYCISFMFKTPESASRQMFLGLLILMLIPMIVEMVRKVTNPMWLEWICAILPPLNIQRVLTMILANIGIAKQNLNYYWTENKHTQVLLIMQYGDVVIYIIVLYIIEKVRVILQNKIAKRTFSNYSEQFREAKARSSRTQEAIDMEESVKNSHDFAIRVEDVSRLFFNTAGKPILAVNGVSLGIKKESLFGFLGANGAGKTTLIRMITSLLPPSHGTIEIFGKNIEEMNDPTAIAVCPQFNNHLCIEMTPGEHFELYGKLFEMSEEEEKQKCKELISALNLTKLKDRPLNELSGGDVRKVAIALSFFGPSKIILLDEPTASLDPVARHDVHEMLLKYRSDKTFMLCTHILSEAESLCDMISIMIHGCVYTCGSPQALTEKFGTFYKIDIMLNDDSEESATKCEQFILQNLPEATLSISRPKSMIYDLPSKDVQLSSVFQVMEDGKEGDNGYSYFTCSSSSLEKVFMEIVKLSESEDSVVF
ncbi:ABC transporter family protein [Tritrichomonas foetus]|uniref:ABC transporter family protein n=1 Tax=Tritrichomonas foetus TaxID=1144522 RepID=A0A1J4KE62_9EUKA|nr:ABC transporter family protein [Tritrichomonas foetus]|eukprot:OHT08004.1 ABC transporter family protein [Tritrichomonas foetus]